MTEMPQKQRICISREVEGNRIEVWIDCEDDFSQGFRTLYRLCERVELESARISFLRFWTRTDDGLILSNEISDGPFRVALSLFLDFPDCKRPVDIQNETGLSSGSVSNILVGRQGDIGHWFNRCEEGWTLSQEGLDDILEGVIEIE